VCFFVATVEGKGGRAREAAAEGGGVQVGLVATSPTVNSVDFDRDCCVGARCILRKLLLGLLLILLVVNKV
jgi:hypothetical protein